MEKAKKHCPGQFQIKLHIHYDKQNTIPPCENKRDPSLSKATAETSLFIFRSPTLSSVFTVRRWMFPNLPHTANNRPSGEISKFCVVKE